MSRAIVAVLILLAWLPGEANAGVDDVIIVQTDGKSPHHKRPPVAGWLALMESDEPRLVPTRLRRIHVRDKASDDLYESDLWASDHPNTNYLLRHPSLLKGPVRSAEAPNDPVISDYAGARGPAITFGNSVYRFHAKSLDAKDPGLRQVTVTMDGATSLLYDWRRSHSTSDNMEIIRWVGDLDRDGRLDFIIDFATYGSTMTCLFLSGQAKP